MAAKGTLIRVHIEIETDDATAESILGFAPGQRRTSWADAEKVNVPDGTVRAALQAAIAQAVYDLERALAGLPPEGRNEIP